jgi:hypothetical protein
VDMSSKPTGTALYWSDRAHKFRETKNPRFKGHCTICAQKADARVHGKPKQA